MILLLWVKVINCYLQQLIINLIYIDQSSFLVMVTKIINTERDHTFLFSSFFFNSFIQFYLINLFLFLFLFEKLIDNVDPIPNWIQSLVTDLEKVLNSLYFLNFLWNFEFIYLLEKKNRKLLSLKTLLNKLFWMFIMKKVLD